VVLSLLFGSRIMLEKKNKKLLKIYDKCKKLFELNCFFFVGRLAEYKYINTDQAIQIGIGVANKILKSK
tara:strand:- start:345 stop:551 length:207 start_codon:yes stop_codon:yes gene_type:complete